MPKIVVVIGAGELAQRIAKATCHALPEATFLIPKDKPRRDILKARIRRHGIIKAAGQVMFRALLKRQARRHAGRVQQIWDTCHLPLSDPDPARCYGVDDVNGPEILEHLKTLQPDVVFIFGVNKLKAETLATTDAPFVNLHPGITPHFRGVHTGYWALAKGRPDQFGATIHLVDAQLDTGPVVEHIRLQPSPADCAATYNTLLATAALPKVFARLADPSLLIPHSETTLAPAPIFHEPTIWQYLWHGLRRGVW